MTKTIVRFAPSPTGYLHVGNLRTAIINWLYAQKTGGEFYLRLDDTDVARIKPEYTVGIKRDLAWLGIAVAHEEKQSARIDRYDAALATLLEQKRVYPCYETSEELDIKRKIQLSRSLPPVYDRSALKLTDVDRTALEQQGIKPHYRFKLETKERTEFDDLVQGHIAMDPASLSDPVVRRADGSYLYMLPSVVDDIDMHITHVVRGQDHLTNSIIQVQMFAALGASLPQFAHLALLSTREQELSKRLGSAGVDHYKALGVLPLSLMAYLARLGTSDPVEVITDTKPLVNSFEWRKFNKANALFDEAELVHINTKILHHLPYNAVKADLPDTITEADWRVIGPNIHTLADVAGWKSIITGPMTPVIEDQVYIATAKQLLASLSWQDDIWQQWTAALKAETGRKGKELFMPLRLALTGLEHGPDMSALVLLIGCEQTLARLA